MAIQSMLVMPQLLKTAQMALSFVFIILVFIAPFNFFFAWFTILFGFFQLFLTTAVWVLFAFEIPLFTTSPVWPEVGYNAIFFCTNTIGLFVFLVRLFNHFNFFYIMLLANIAVLAGAFGYNAWLRYRNRGDDSTGAAGGASTNQATATPGNPRV